MTTRERILDAAIPVFARKGRYGARMEDIAALAHINKAMIYYIFHSKDELYLEVLKFVLSKASSLISEITDEAIKSRNDYISVLSDFISAQIKFYSENRYYTKILLDALSSNAEEIPVAVEHYKNNHGDKSPDVKLRKIIEKGKADRFFRDVNTDQLIISMIGMVIIHFFSQSVTEVLNIEVRDEKKFLEERRDSIIDLVLSSIIISSPDGPTQKRNKS